MPIKSFKSKSLKRYWENNDASGFPKAHIERIGLLLDLIHAAEEIQDLKPFFRFHEYKGGGKGVYSHDISGNYRLLYRFEDGDGFDLWYGDPHGKQIGRIMGN